jgi:protein gp37
MGKIEWADHSWSVVSGCSEISDGCEHCYAKRLSKRLHAMACSNGDANTKSKYAEFGDLTYDFTVFDKVKKIRKPSFIFLDSMGDVFHNDFVGREDRNNFIMSLALLFGALRDKGANHALIFLTKRPGLIDLPFSKETLRREYPNLFVGVSVEDNDSKHRISDLKEKFPGRKMISFEPLLGEIKLAKKDLKGIDWVIVGGETGPKAREMRMVWADSIQRLCSEMNIPFFFKGRGTAIYRKSDYIYYNLLGKYYQDRPKLLECKVR